MLECKYVEILFFLLTTVQNLTLHSDRRGRDHMVVGFTTTYGISAYHY
jgi:hypothetical protein